MSIGFKPPIKFFYNLSKINGLAPFLYTTKPLSIKTTLSSTVFSIVFFIFLCHLLLLQGICYVSADFHRLFPTNLLKYVLIAELSYDLILIFVIYMLQLINREIIVFIINQYINLWKSISLKYPRKIFFDSKFRKLYKIQLTYVCNQTFLTLTISLCLISLSSISKSIIAMITYVFVIYLNILIFNFIYVFYYGGILTSLQFFQIVNDQLELYSIKLKNLEKQFNLNVFCELSDEIDFWSNVYCELTIILKKMHTIFVFQIIYLLFGSLFKFTALVIEDNLIFNIKLFNFCFFFLFSLLM